MAFIWVDSASKVRSPYEVKARNKRVDKVEHATSGEAIGDAVDTFTLSEEYQEAAAHLAYKQAAEKKDGFGKPLYAEDIMSSPVKTLGTTASLTDALLFIKNERFRHVPITNSEGVLVGIISDRDFFRYYYEKDTNEQEALENITDLIKSRVLTASPDTRISEIARIMFEEKIGAMPILDSSHSLTGIITRSDILRALVKRTSFESWA